MTQEVNKIKIDKNSILFKLWKYFICFAALILIIIWLFQTVFLSNLYEKMKIHEVTKVGNLLRREYLGEDFENTLKNYANRKGMDIKVLDSEGTWLYPIKMFQIIQGDVNRPKMIGENFEKFFKTLNRENLTYKVYTVRYENLDDPSIIYAGTLGNNGEYLYINTVLKPVDATIDILRKILIIVSICSLFIALFISYFVSKRISKPLVKMSRTAKKLAGGDHQIEFNMGNYTEIDELSKALNYAKEELVKTLDMRRDLIANISHDLKTPITVIRSYAEMIKDISGSEKKTRDMHLDIIISESDHLTNLVNDLLSISKMESSIESLKLQKFDLSKSAEIVVNRFRQMSAYKKFNFKFKSQGQTFIYADEKKMMQVIYNLLTNAINYSRDKRYITISVREEEKYIRFDCIDRGIGIDKKDFDGIWQRFYRVSNNMARSQIGTGLGLSIVKSILDMHGFKYGLNSKLGLGSDFYFLAKKYRD